MSERSKSSSSGYEEEEDSDEEVERRSRAGVTKLSRAQQAEVAQMIGDTMSRLEPARRCRGLLRQCAPRRRVPRPCARVLLRKIADAKATLRIQHQNAARQPLLHEASGTGPRGASSSCWLG